MVGLKNSHIHKKISPKMVNPRDIVGNTEEEEGRNYGEVLHTFLMARIFSVRYFLCENHV